MKLIFTTYKNLEQYLTSLPQNTQPVSRGKEYYGEKKSQDTQNDDKGVNSVHDGGMTDKGDHYT